MSSASAHVLRDRVKASHALARVVLGRASARWPRRRPTARKPPAVGPPPALKLPRDPEAAAVERPAGVDRRAARGAGRAGEPRRPERQRRRSGGQVRRREPDRRDAHRRRRLAIVARDRRRRRLPRRRPRRRRAAIDATAVRLHVPVARLAEALPIMADVALRPTFPREELERAAAAAAHRACCRRATIRRRSRALAFSRVLFGPAHRFGTATMGTADDDQGVHRRRSARVLRPHVSSRQRHAHRRRRRRRPTSVLPLLETSFGAWKAAAAPRRRASRCPHGAAPDAREVYLVDKPGAPQSQIRIGGVGVPRSTPDYFPIQVMNTVLGGSFTSRLNLNLREKHGYTYGAASSFDMRVERGPVRRRGRRADRQDRRVAEGVLQRAERDPAAGARPTSSRARRTTSRCGSRAASRRPATSRGGSRTCSSIALPDDYFSKYVAEHPGRDRRPTCSASRGNTSSPTGSPSSSSATGRRSSPASARSIWGGSTS